MTDKPAPPKKLTDKNTKQEMLEAYQALVRQLEEKRAAELRPEKRQQEKQAEEAVAAAAGLAPDGVERALGNLKADIGKSLAEIAERMASEVTRFKAVQKAVESKERELQELYGIEKAAASLAALIEAQNQKRSEFEIELERQKEELNREIETTRAEWEKEKKSHEAELRERDALEKKGREREKEEFTYLFKREQQSVRDKLQDEKAGLEKEILAKRESVAKELAEREKSVAAQEKELAELRQRAAAFPKELESTVDKAVKEATERLKLEAKNREDLLRREFEGERNVLAARIEALEKMNKDLGDQSAKFSKQLENAYQKVQEIAEKAIEGSSQARSLADLQKLLAEQGRKTPAEKA
ncbi:MAG TPA: hypothetical protein VLM91_13125 [Candidatus Methylomirabilis sp.]|nr:hypothetical protein [Candidatus Methylomirabilis sp.]